MKTKSRLLGSTIFFLAAILLTGCVGGLTGGDTDQTVQGFLTEVTSAIVSLGPERIAALIDFPIIFSDEIYNEETGTVENIDVNITSANFVDFTQDAFDIARADGTRLLVKITVKDDGILYGQNTAVIKDAVVSVEIEFKEETAKKLSDSIGRAILDELASGETLFSEEEIHEILEDAWKDLRYEIAGEGEWPGQWGPVEENLQDFELKKVGTKWRFSTSEVSLGTLSVLSSRL